MEYAVQVLFQIVVLLLLWPSYKALLDDAVTAGYLPADLGPLTALTVLSLPFYALVVLFGLQFVTAWRSSGRWYASRFMSAWTGSWFS